MRVTQEQLHGVGDVPADARWDRSWNFPADRSAGLIAAGLKALRAAALYKHWDLYKSLLERSTGSLYRALAGEALVISSGIGDVKTVASLLGTDADVFERMGEALSDAATNAHPDIVKLIAAHQAASNPAKLDHTLLAGGAPSLAVLDPSVKASINAREIRVAKLTDEDAARGHHAVASAI